MEIYIANTQNIDLKQRMDFNYWVPRTSQNSNIQYEKIYKCMGQDCLTASAFYPAITPFYQSKKDAENDAIPFLRVTDARKGLLSFDETVFLSEELLDQLSRSIKQVTSGDVVITKGGEYIGEAALVPPYYNNYAICRDLLAIKTSKLKSTSFSGAYVAAYFQSEIGKSELLRTRSVQGQPHLTLNKIYNIDIPILPEHMISEIEEYYSSFFSLIEASNSHLVTAESLLNEVFKGKLYRQQSLDIFAKNLSSNELTKRCDFEYYQKKWENLVDELSIGGMSFHSVTYCKDVISLDDPQYIYNYITLSDIDDRSGIINTTRELPTYQLPSRARRKIRHNDVLVSSLKGSRDKIAIVDEALPENLVASTGFYIVRDEFMLPEVLYLLFRSRYYTLFIEQMSSGAIMSSITEQYFKQFKVPNLEMTLQTKIAEEIKSYHYKRQDAFENLAMAISKFSIL